MARHAAGDPCERAALGASGRALRPRHAARRSSADRAAGGVDLGPDLEQRALNPNHHAVRVERSRDTQRPRAMLMGVSTRSEEHTSVLQSLKRNSYAVFCLTKKLTKQMTKQHNTNQLSCILQ